MFTKEFSDRSRTGKRTRRAGSRKKADTTERKNPLRTLLGQLGLHRKHRVARPKHSQKNENQVQELTGILSKIGWSAALGSRGGVSNGFRLGAPSNGLAASFLLVGELKGLVSSLADEKGSLNGFKGSRAEFFR